MNAKKKIELIDNILERWEEKSCFYCGGVLNGNMADDDYDDMNSDTYCQYCGKENKFDAVFCKYCGKDISD